MRAVLVFFCFAFTVTNGLLIRQNTFLRNEIRSYDTLLYTPIGAVMPSLSGWDTSGTEITLPYTGAAKTLMLVFSPTCGYCKKSWAAWAALIRRFPEERVVFVNIGGSLSGDFFKQFPTYAKTLLVKTAPESILRYRLRETPITIALDAHGRVLGAWGGEVGTSREKEIEDRLRD
jgi:hypothetical protein